MKVTVSAGDLEAATRFYKDVFDFRLVRQGASSSILEHGDLGLTLLKAEPAQTSTTQPVHLRLIVADPKEIDEIALRVKRFGYPFVEELHEQADGMRAFACLGPENHLVEVLAEPARSYEKQGHPQTRPATTIRSPAAPPQATPPARAMPPIRPTKADRYMLEAQERLARIKEEFASLTTSFSQTDIAGTIDEMREKIARRVVDIAERVAPASESSPEPSAAPDQNAEKTRQEAEDALARYKQIMATEPAETSESEEEEALKPVRKTLGPAPGDDPSGDRKSD